MKPERRLNRVFHTASGGKFSRSRRVDANRFCKILLHYKIDGHPVFDPRNPAEAERLSEMLALTRRIRSGNESLQSPLMEYADSIRARCRDKRIITDDAMGTGPSVEFSEKGNCHGLIGRRLIHRSRFAPKLMMACVGVLLATYTCADTSELYPSGGIFKSVSIQQVIGRARPGDKVKIPPGIYREFVQITQSGTAQRPVVIEGASSGGIVITGSDPIAPDRWIPLPDRPVWRISPWTYDAPSRHLDPSGPVYSGEQVIVDGELMTRASSLKSMRPGNFFADPVKDHALFLWLPDGSPPPKHTVEVSVRPTLLKITGSHVIVRNLRFRYASNVAQWAAVEVDGEYNLVENCTVEYTAGLGLSLAGRHNVVRRVTSEFNGQAGMGGHGQDNLLEQCRLVNNNTLDYPRQWEAGGIKVTASDRFRISQCVASKNNGVGFWFDIDNRYGTIERSYAADNVASGIMVEISQEMTVVDNIAVRNGLDERGGWARSGILIAESMHSLLEHNICVGNFIGLCVRQQGVRVVQALPELGRPQPVRFYSDSLVFRGNIAAFNRRWQLAFFGDNPSFGGDNNVPDAAERKLLDPSSWAWQFNHNLYFAPPGSGLILWGAPWRPGHKVYDSLETFRSEQHLDQASIVADPKFAEWKTDDFALRPDSPAVELFRP